MTAPVYYDRFDSPIGPLTIAADASGLRHVLFAQHCRPARDQASWLLASDADVLVQPRRQLLQYLNGQRQHFDLALAPVGTDFQRTVWQALARIPFAATWSYRQLATEIGRPTATRAVGAANSRNPLPIILPCHRVVGSNGGLTGFAGGLEVKQALLALENAQAPA